MNGNYIGNAIFLCAALLAVLAPLAGAAERSADRRPNVLFIAVDDLNDWIGALGGHPQAQTPNIDRLAQRGMLFTNAHCAAPLCNPSRTAVMSGMMPATSGVHGNQQDWRLSPYLKGKPTLPQYFKQNGYWTGGCGKLFHANHGGECGAYNGGHGGLRGFNHPEAWTARHPSKNQQLAKPAVMPGQNFNGLDIWHWDWGPIDVSDAATTDGQTTDWAVAQLQKEHDRPFFLAVGIYKPHGPWYAPRQYFDRHPLDRIVLPTVKEDDLDDVPDIAKRYVNSYFGNYHRRILENDLYHSAVQAYLANVTFADAMIGKVLDALAASPYADNTVICLWSDHGWHLGEKYRWHKSTCWEEATRVPLIFVAPGLTQPGNRCTRPVSLIDMYPTLVELCGLPQRDDLDGLSLVEQLSDPQAARKRPAVTTLAGRHHSVRGQRWRYTLYSDGSEELYDHDIDPGEHTNLAGEPRHAATKRQLAAWLPKEVHTVAQQSGGGAEPGFRPLFNGRDLTGWEGDDKHWSVQDGTITGTTTDNNPLPYNKFLIWRGGTLKDFELRLEARLIGDNNSGIQYRSRERKDLGQWVVSGYQADMHPKQANMGMLYEEKGRRILAQRGQKVVIDPRGKPKVTGQVGDAAQEFKIDRWNTYTVIARGNHLIHKVNDNVTAEVIDNHEAGRALSGILALQIHRGPAMKVQFRNIRLKEFAPSQ